MGRKKERVFREENGCFTLGGTGAEKLEKKVCGFLQREQKKNAKNVT